MRGFYTIIHIILIHILVFISIHGIGQEEPSITTPESIYVFDTINDLSVQEVLLIFEEEKTPVLTKSTTFGFTTHYYWLKLTLNNTESKTKPYIIAINNPHIDLLKAWQVLANGEIKQLYTGGDALPFSERTFKNRNLIIPVDLPANKTTSVLILADKRNASLSVPITIIEASKFKTQVKKSYFLYGTYFGIMFLIVLFSFFMFTILKQEIFFWYAFYITFLGLYLMAHTGFLFQLIYPEQNWFNNLSRPIFISISSAALVHFIRLLLNVKVLLPRLNKWYNFLIITLLVTTSWWALTPWWHNEQTIIFLNIQNISLLGSLILVVTSSFLTYSHQKVIVKFFWIAFLAVLFSGIFVILIEAGVINETKVLINPLFIGSLMEILVFAMGLSYWSKINEDNRLRLIQVVQNNKLRMIDSYLNGIESEKQKISSDLHDDIGSSLSHLKRKAESSGADQEEVMKIFDTILKKVRTISHDLAPPIFETDEFLNSIQYLAQTHESETTMVNLQVFNTPIKLEKNTTKQLYRIIQNGLAHIEKHTQATVIDVQLFYHKGELALAFEDNGFSIKQSNSKQSMEITEMKTRIEILHGTIEISSFSSQGTSIMITVPI